MTSRFLYLSVRGYRRRKAVDIPLLRQNVLIGTNGVGKTSVLDVFHLLGVSPGRRLAAAVCPELNAFRNTILTLRGGTALA